MEQFIRTPKSRGLKKIYSWDDLKNPGDELRYENTTIQKARMSFYQWSLRQENKFKVKMWTAIDNAVWIQRL